MIEEDGIINDPMTYESLENSTELIEAMEDEITSIEKNNVWELSDLSNGWKIIWYKWILKKKYTTDDAFDKYKARLVTKGFTQQPKIDFEYTNSPIAKFVFIKILIAIVAYMDLKLY